MRYSYPELGYDLGLKYEKQPEMLPAHMMDQAISNAITYLGTEALRPMLHPPGPPLSMADVVPMVNPLFHHVLPLGRAERPAGCDATLLPQHHDLPGLAGNVNGPAAPQLNRKSQATQKGHEESPSNSGLDSDSARSSPQERHGYHRGIPPPGRSRASPSVVFSGERGAEPGVGNGSMRVAAAAAERPGAHDGVRVLGSEGQELRAFQCEHCRVLFLDHVMYTIHMGCHGYRDPLECNICGHRSKDRYEFSSHIVRGEHTFQ